MKVRINEAILPYSITILIFIILEIIGTTFWPMIGFEKIRLPFNILIILFMGFKLEIPFLAVLILIIQYFHSFFTIEGWAMGTIAGVTVCIIISYLRDLINFHSAILTIIVTQMFQILWFVLVAFMIYIKLNDFGYILEKFTRFIPESIIISLLAPIFFPILEKIWKVQEQ